MALIAFLAPILPGKREQWDQFIGELNGARKADFDASRQSRGVHERTFMQETPMGDIVIVTIEGDDPMGFMTSFASSDDEFTRWFVQQVQEIHGFDLREPPPSVPRLVADSAAG
jgi:hypothetical protein